MWVAFGLILLIISAGDFLFFRIENEYVLSLMVLYAISYMLGVSGRNFTEGLVVAVATFVITLALNRFNLIGGGDVKLLFPVILFSENNISNFLVGISVGGVVLAAMYLIFSRQIFFIRRNLVRYLYAFNEKQKKSSLLRFVLLSLSRIDRRIVALSRYKFDAMRQEIPYGIAISCGGFCVIFENLAAGW
ncbi:MAG: prepilin peptidase [Holosporaceae bacterium]|nr:prepilin peptidase [Holosporaceae bacterium]